MANSRTENVACLFKEQTSYQLIGNHFIVQNLPIFLNIPAKGIYWTLCRYLNKKSKMFVLNRLLNQGWQNCVERIVEIMLNDLFFYSKKCKYT